MNEPQLNPRPQLRKLRHFWRFFWLSFLVLSLAYAWYCFYVPSNEVAWTEDFASAKEVAVESKRPIILYFTGTWCVPCRIMKREVWADQQVAATVNSRFVAVSIDVSDADNASLLTQFNVKGAPVTIVTDHEGSPIDWRAGGISKSEFLELLQSSERKADVGSHFQ